MDDQIEARERRRAKILASKDARMSRITGAHKNESSASPPIEVDEVLVQEYIAESKKHAVELAKADYSLTHKENEDRPDEPLNPQEIKLKKEQTIQNQLAQFHQQSKFDIFMGILVVAVSALSAAFFLLKRARESSLDFCFNVEGIASEAGIETCRRDVLPIFLQTVPGTLVVALLPVLSEWFKERKSLVQVILAFFPKILLFAVIFLVSLRILQ